jgi:hypothetical protein
MNTDDIQYDPIDDHDESDNVLSEGDEELTIDITTPASEKQKFIAKGVKEVKCSKRIAEIYAGYKDKDAIDKSLKK